MTYRSLLVHLGHDPHHGVRTRAAIRLAQRMGAHLVGLAPTGQVEMPLAIEPAASLGNLGTLVWEAMQEQARLAAERFSEACAQAGLHSCEAVVDEQDPARSLVRHAHCSDLCIVSQADPASPGFREQQRLVEEVLLHSARPTLVLPCVDALAGFGQAAGTALVAWDDSREAARAVADALPMLRLASQVQVIRWLESDEDDAEALAARLLPLQRWLMWQGVSAEVHGERTEIGVADAILSRAADLGAELLVMGGYGHTRLTERIFGGATRGLLASMTLPVLMSH
jgi:nucleotide-binding universal stress UspA family protein